MNKIFYILTIALLLLFGISTLTCYSQISKTPTFLWAVFAKGDTIPSFIYGTVHHLGPKPILNNKKLFNIISSSRQIVMEADTNEILHSKKSIFNYNVETPLDELIGFSDYHMVQQEFYLATGKELDKYRYKMPQMIMNLIIDGRESQDPTFEKKPLMENALYAICRVMNIPIRGLETREDLYNITFKGMPLKEQAALLLYYLKDLKFNTTDAQMMPCFQQQDLDCLCKIEDITNYTRPGDSSIVLNRNLFWLPRIEGFIKEKRVFIAVGAAHLCGNYGIIALLKKKGYNLIPVKL